MVLALVRAAALLAAIIATVSGAAAQERLKVVTSFTIIADMAKNVAGDAADVVSITKPGAEIHNYQPTPRDIVGAQGADMVLWNGLNLEQWFERFLVNIEGAKAIGYDHHRMPFVFTQTEPPHGTRVFYIPEDLVAAAGVRMVNTMEIASLRISSGDYEDSGEIEEMLFPKWVSREEEPLELL